MFCVSSVYMEQEALRTQQEYEGRYRPRSVTPSFSGFLALIGRMLFYRPIWTEENQQHHNIRFIHVHFSAWHFAGSDLLWAGLAIRLFHAMQMNFGKLRIVLYRVAQHNEEDEIKNKVRKFNFSQLISKIYSHASDSVCTWVQLCFELNACQHAYNDIMLL